MIGLAEARQFEAAASAMLDALEPDAVPSTDAVAVWEALDAAARKITAMAALMARRVDDSRAWARAGERNAADFMAKRSGNSVASARAQLDVSRTAEALPTVADALRSGKVSGAQAALVVEGGRANPEAVPRLLEQAQRGSLKELRDEVLRVRAAADPDPETTQRRIHSRREYRSWLDAEGGWHAGLHGTALAGARFEARLKALIDEGFAEARAEGRCERREAYAFDAVMALAERTAAQPGKQSARFTTIVRVEFDALRRGTLEDGDTCDLPGLGPISATSARELLGESILKLVITKGVDVLNVTHLGRGPNAAQKIALLWSSPMCSVAGCSHAAREIDHREPYANNPETRLENLDPLCKYHHDLKTRQGWALVEGRGTREMVPPDDQRHPKNKPKHDTN